MSCAARKAWGCEDKNENDKDKELARGRDQDQDKAPRSRKCAYSIYAAAGGKGPEPAPEQEVPEGRRDGVWERCECGRVRLVVWVCEYRGQYGVRACWTACSNGSRAKRMGQSSSFWG